jgi:hypothetical protein
MLLYKDMQIAHEAPMDIMDLVQVHTDYDYCLVHLLEESRRYLDFFEYSSRKIIMDCSLFELGEAFDFRKYYKWLLRIQPDEYIVPDVWQSCEENLASYEKFNKDFDLSALTGKRLGVLQGKTYEDFARDMERDFFMSAQEACDYGLVDTVVSKHE